jgi:hypothetical protein
MIAPYVVPLAFRATARYIGHRGKPVARIERDGRTAGAELLPAVAVKVASVGLEPPRTRGGVAPLKFTVPLSWTESRRQSPVGRDRGRRPPGREAVNRIGPLALLARGNVEPK